MTDKADEAQKEADKMKEHLASEFGVRKSDAEVKVQGGTQAPTNLMSMLSSSGSKPGGGNKGGGKGTSRGGGGGGVPRGRSSRQGPKRERLGGRFGDRSESPCGRLYECREGSLQPPVRNELVVWLQFACKR